MQDDKAARGTGPLFLGFGALGLLTVVPVLLAVVSPWGCEQFTDAFPIGIEALRACPLAIDALGDNPDKTWGFSNFEVGSNGETGNAHFTTKVTGGKQVGEYQVFATRTFSRWTLLSAKLLLPKQERVIDVLTCLEELQPR